MNMLEPWVALRLVAGLVSATLLLRASYTGFRVLRHFRLARATEGQLLLERRLDLAGTFVRVGAFVQIACVAFTALAADRLSVGIRGAMCGYGVFQASPWGFPALVMDVVLALLAGLAVQLFAFDARMRTFELARPLALCMMALAPLALADFALSARFLLDLDLTVVASCCSVSLDTLGSGAADAHAAGPRAPATLVAIAAIGASVAVGLLAARRPTRARAILAGALSLAALPFAVAAAMLEVAPHAFEVPQHVCPFCLLKPEVLGLGYPLFGAMFVAATWAGGAALSGLMVRTGPAREAFAPFAKERLRAAAVAWVAVLVVGAAPVLRYALVSNFTPLFP